MQAVGSIPGLPHSGSTDRLSASNFAHMKLFADVRVISPEIAAAQIGAIKRLLEAPLSMLAFGMNRVGSFKGGSNTIFKYFI